MPESTVAPFGTWTSPITSDLIVAGTVGLGDLCIDGQDIYWNELRPTEKGRSVLVHYRQGDQAQDCTPAPWNVRSRVHEYGGGAFTVHQGRVYFVHNDDQRIYQQVGGQDPQPLTPANAQDRYADLMVDAGRNRLICIRETHRSEQAVDVVNCLVAVDLDAASPETAVQLLAQGHDFYASPCLSPDGQQLAWLTWDHPNMPWDGTDLWVATIEADGQLREPQQIAGGPEESVFQPQWSPAGWLCFVCDRSNWHNLYRWHNGHIEALYPMDAEFGLPQWVFAMSTYGFISGNEILCTYNQAGNWILGHLNTDSHHLVNLETPYTDISGVRVGPDFALFQGSAPTLASEIVRFDLKTHTCTAVRSSSSVDLELGYLSQPEVLEFPTEHGLTAYGFFYPPTNKDFQGPEAERPPLLVKSHGGPTAATSSRLSLKIQYWTSRGFAVLDVNYGGSTGYGRAYQLRLRGQWGIVDVDDCVNGALYLANQGRIDRDRMAITGGSAGGYTTLAALAFRDVFKAGASYYGVGDLEALAQDTHKFEARYLDRLVGSYPEQQSIYKARSPIHAVEQLSCPVIFLQGLQDKVVPPNQAQAMVDALQTKGIDVEHITFADEKHGFRNADNIRHALDSELKFYQKIFCPSRTVTEA